MPGQTKLGHGAEAYCPHCERSFSPESQVCPSDGTTLVQFDNQREQMVGKVLAGRFEITGKLGSGGMGTVYLAKQLSVGRDVAVKIIDPTLSREREASKRFLREAKLASRLSQPNTVVVHDFGQDGGVLFIVMERLRGKTLSRLLKDTGPLPAARIRRIGGQLCDALEAAHGLDVIHRDIKPSNIMILDEPAGRDVVKVLDFGLAKSLIGDTTTTAITQSGAVMGTPLYMPPEMIHGEIAGKAADIYSLGCVFHEMATGLPPFVAPSSSALFAKHLTESVRPIDRPDLGGAVDIISRMLQKHPGERPTAAEVHSSLIKNLSDSDVTTAPKAKALKAKAKTGSISTARTVTAANVGHTESAFTTAKQRPARRSWPVVVAALAVVVTAVLVWRFALVGSDATGDQAAAPIAALTPKSPEPAATPPLTPVAAAAAADASIEGSRVVTPPGPVAVDKTPPGALAVKVKLVSKPAASVYVDGRKLGRSPRTHSVAAGTSFVVEFRRRGYRSERRTITPTEDTTRQVSLTRRKPRTPVKTEPRTDDPPDIDFIKAKRKPR